MRQSFRRAVCALLAASGSPFWAEAAVIRGVALDNYTGRPLARALVTLEMVQPNGVVRVTVRTARDGQFLFSPLRAGTYLLSAARTGYSTLKYGQKFWNAPGAPILLAEESTPFLDLRLHRLGAVAGSVWDENEIGISEQEVYAYRPSRPPVLIARGKTDDRGVYRIGGLSPGAYLIRSGPKQLDEETGVLPTFYRDTASVDEARTVEVGLDQQLEDINIRPGFGKLLRLSGEAVVPTICRGPLLITLSSELGRATASTPQFTFDELSPGAYELTADCSDPRNPYAAYQAIQLYRDVEKMSLQLMASPSIQLSIEGEDGKRIDPQLVSVLARRRDLAGPSAPMRVKDGMAVLPGRWELTVAPAGNLYPVSISAVNPDNAMHNRPDAWNEYLLNARAGKVALKVVMASGAAAIHGTVTKSLGDPAAGAPVYLEAFDPALNRRLVDLRKTLTGPRGEYSFSGLTPGSYRIVSSFEFEDPDERTMEAARAPVAQLKLASDTQQNLDLYTQP